MLLVGERNEDGCNLSCRCGKTVENPYNMAVSKSLR